MLRIAEFACYRKGRLGKILNMKVMLIGAGAVGCTVMNKLMKVSDFTLIVDHERKQRYSNGIFYNGEKLEVVMKTPEEADEKADLLILATKNFHLDDAIEEAKPFVGPTTVLLPILNGIDAEGKLADVFGEDKVLYGFITDLSSNHQGVETTCFSEGTIIFGEKNNAVSERMKNIAELFDKAGQRYQIPQDIHHEKWWKFMLNTCYNTLTAILIADYAAINGNQSFVRCIRMVAKEVLEVANAEGVALTGDDVESMIKRIGRLTDHGQTSMLQDVLAKRDTENKYFAGAVSRLGKKHGIETPYCEFINHLLEAKRYVYNS